MTLQDSPRVEGSYFIPKKSLDEDFLSYLPSKLHFCPKFRKIYFRNRPGFGSKSEKVKAMG